MTGKAGLETSVDLVISMERGCQSRSFNCLISPVSWASATDGIRDSDGENACDGSEHG